MPSELGLDVMAQLPLVCKPRFVGSGRFQRQCTNGFFCCELLSCVCSPFPYEIKQSSLT